MSLEFEQYITIEEGTTINTGPHEDSDSLVATSETMLAVLGPRKEGALPVRIVGDGFIYPEIFYFHQPELPWSNQ